MTTGNDPTESRPTVTIRTAGKDRYTRISHPGSRYVVSITGQGSVYVRSLAEAKAEAARVLGQKVTWSKRSFLNGRQTTSEWLPVVSS